MPKQPQPVLPILEVEVDEAEAKQQRKAAKRAAKEAADAHESEAAEADAKKQRKAAKKAAAAAEAAPEPDVEEEEVDEAEAKRLRKAAKKAAKAAAEAQDEAAPEDEVDAEEAKRQRKAAKRAAKEAAAAADAEDAEETPAPKKAKKEAASETPAAAAGEKTASAGAAADRDGDFTAFVRGLPFSAEEAVVKKDFEACGEIISFNFPYLEDGRPRGLCFVKYATRAGMEAALKFDNTDYGGRYLEVKPAWDGTYSADKGAKGKGEKGKGKAEKGDKGKGKSDKGKGKGDKDGKGKGGEGSEFAVFVGGLPFTADEAAIRAHFSECGELSSVRIPMDEHGSANKGIAFLRFTNDDDVGKAVLLNESEIEGRWIIVRKAVDNRKGDGKGKDGKDGKEGKAKGKGKDGKGKKGKKGKGGNSPEAARCTGTLVESTGTKQTFEDSDEE